jgi:type II secretory pathway predicted ATPase ExeA/nucleoid-associated protein YgaU
MYSSFFGFSEKPFEVTPDPKFLYLTPSHQEMLASLVYGIRERRGFIVVSGEVGTGKTTLINAALDRLDDQTEVANLCNTSLSFDQLLEVSLMELGLSEPGEPLPKVESIRRLNDFAIKELTSGGTVVLIVDEAQNLDDLSLENLRLLSNLETRKHKLIQIVLSGQPELDVKLNRPELRQLAQRISVRRCIRPLTEEETYAYIEHRLAVAGAKDSGIFGSNAKKRIYKLSAGFPRKINVLCDNALLIAYGMDKKTVDIDILEEAARDLGWTPLTTDQNNVHPHGVTPVSPPVHERSRFFQVALVAVIALLGGILLARWMPLTTSSSLVQALQDQIQQRDSEVKSLSKDFDDLASHRPPSVSHETGEAKQTGMNLEAAAPNPSSRSTSEETPALPKLVSQINKEEGGKLQARTPPEEHPLSPSVNPNRNLKGTSPFRNFNDRTSNRSPSVSPESGEAKQTGTNSQTAASNPSSQSTSEQTPVLPKLASRVTTDEGGRLPAVTRGEEQPPSPSVNQISLDSARKPGSTNNPLADRSTDLDVTVQKDQTLSGIIFSICGEFNPTILNAVMGENPHILSPNHIYPGQVIRIPKRLGQVD